MKIRTVIILTVLFSIFLAITYLLENFKYTGIHYGGYLMHGGLSFIILMAYGLAYLDLLKNKRLLTFVVFIVWLLSSVNEGLQLFQPDRVFDWFDILNQSIGILTAYILLIFTKSEERD